ncbi:MAG: 3'-5' exonuclease [Bacteroidota bacterium]
MNIKELKNILIVDIETVSSQPDFWQMNPRLQDQWARKSEFFKNEDDLSVAELFSQRASLYAEFGKIVSIGVGVFYRNEEAELSMRVKAFSGDDEKEILNNFKELLETKFDSDHLKLCCHNGKEFDYPYLCRRMLINKISIPMALNLRDRKPWEVQHLDTMEMWKFGDRRNYATLELMTALLGIESSKVEEDGSPIDGTQVNRLYYKEKGLERIVRYCKQDVVATAQLYLRLNEHELMEKSNITIL